MTLPDDRKIFELIETGAVADARDMILALRQAAVTLAEENLDLREQIVTLQGEVAALRSTRGNHCPRCGKETWIVQGNQPDERLGDMGVMRRTWQCGDCGFTASALVADGGDD